MDFSGFASIRGLTSVAWLWGGGHGLAGTAADLDVCWLCLLQEMGAWHMAAPSLVLASALGIASFATATFEVERSCSASAIVWHRLRYCADAVVTLGVWMAANIGGWYMWCAALALGTIHCCWEWRCSGIGALVRLIVAALCLLGVAAVETIPGKGSALAPGSPVTESKATSSNADSELTFVAINALVLACCLLFLQIIRPHSIHQQGCFTFQIAAESSPDTAAKPRALGRRFVAHGGGSQLRNGGSSKSIRATVTSPSSNMPGGAAARTSASKHFATAAPRSTPSRQLHSQRWHCSPQQQQRARMQKGPRVESKLNGSTASEKQHADLHPLRSRHRQKSPERGRAAEQLKSKPELPQKNQVSLATPEAAGTPLGAVPAEAAKTAAESMQLEVLLKSSEGAPEGRRLPAALPTDSGDPLLPSHVRNSLELKQRRLSACPSTSHLSSMSTEKEQAAVLSDITEASCTSTRRGSPRPLRRQCRIASSCVRIGASTQAEACGSSGSEAQKENVCLEKIVKKTEAKELDRSAKLNSLRKLPCAGASSVMTPTLSLAPGDGKIFVDAEFAEPLQSQASVEFSAFCARIEMGHCEVMEMLRCQLSAVSA
eukprot:TRINITY_DN33964_c0_g1_i1.p1 TRINITY_DN33964_c0_g1~~TRINITY_DN33964_c0_g1_i1.p1  ORF type:complete len:603 (-),score=96.99 TRINITY_DN33964_c0_g1_i1:315-2123(-)